MSDPMVSSSEVEDAEAVARAAKQVLDKCKATATNPDQDCKGYAQQFADAQDVVMALATEDLQARKSRVDKINDDLATIESRVSALLASEETIIKASNQVANMISDIQDAFGLSGASGTPAPAGGAAPKGPSGS